MLSTFLEWVRQPRGSHWELVHHEVLPEKPAEWEPIPSQLHPRVRDLILASGVPRLYSHQAEAIRLALQGKDAVLCTATASGKTLAFQAPVLDRLIRDPTARALFLFPLKALERDQKESFLSLADGAGITAAVYDGDTPDAERRKIRIHPPRVLITNPDMLHLSLLAFHDTWKDFFGNLAHVVLDEVHTYKGIFGTHISQVILRMLRVCNFHGAHPQFTACSATVANPGEFVSTLIGREVAVVDRSGAPSSERHFLFLNPVLSPNTVAARLFVEALRAGLKTIVFTRARKITELITTWVLQQEPRLKDRISSYRAGFLPEERREIEAKLFSGRMDGVISTSALEMGIDVGGLDLCVLVGYPGTIMNTWQRGGRVGRAARPSAIALIAGSDALDQYFMRNPQDFFERNCEQAILDPFNTEVLKRHMPCAAAEIPITPEEEWTRRPQIQSVLDALQETGELNRTSAGVLVSAERRPHRGVDLRGIGESFPIFLEDRKTLIGSSAGARVFTECHKGAVYLHRARQFLVTGLDLERRNVLVKPGRLPYYTRALSEKDTEILGMPIRQQEFPGFWIKEARLKVTERVTSYEKRRISGQELVAVVELDLPPLHFETVGIWIEVPDRVKEAIKNAGLNFMGGIHALEHAAISMFPLFALCDRDDIGGISTPHHEQVCRAAVFIYDGHPGGVGLAHRAFEVILELLEKTRVLVEQCRCDDGCPSCIHSPKCGSGNKPLDKKACLATLKLLLDPSSEVRAKSVRPRRGGEVLFPDLADYEAAAVRSSEKRRPQGRRVTRSQESDASPMPGSHLGGAVREPPEIRALLEAPLQESNADTVPDGESSVSPLSRRRGTASRAHNPDTQPDMRAHENPVDYGAALMRKNVVVFDLETQKLAQDVGGWKNISKMRLSLGVAHTREQGFLTFTEDNVSELIALLKAADLVVGFNHVRFDYEVLRAYTSEDLKALPNLDILLDVQGVLGHRLALDHLAENTLGEKKSGSGLDAQRWFLDGKMDLLEKYCRDDVRITRNLFLFGMEKGFLLYRPRDREVTRVRVDWARHVG